MQDTAFHRLATKAGEKCGLGFLYHSKQFVLEVQADFLAFFEIIVRGGFNSGFDAMYFVIDFVVFVEQPGKVIIGHLEIVDGIAVFGQFMYQVVFFA